VRVLHLYLALPHERGVASRERRVLDHVWGDVAEGASVHVITNVDLDPPCGASVEAIDGALLPEARDSALELERLNVLAFASGLEMNLRDVQLVVAHGAASLPAAVRLAKRTRSRLLLNALEDEDAVEALRGRDDPTSAWFEWAKTQGVEVVTSRPGPEVDESVFDVGIGDGAPWDLADHVLTRVQRVAVVKGLTAAEQASALSDAKVVLVPHEAKNPLQRAQDTLAAGGLPVLLGKAPEAVSATLGEGVLPHAASGSELGAILTKYLSDESARASVVRAARYKTAAGGRPRRGAAPRPLKIVLNHGGLVAKELADSLGPLSWELRSLSGESGDPLPGADFLVVLPYGDPKGALAAVKRATPLGVPSVFWNVEDPRYFFDPELGPIVREMARASSAVFSTTLQLEREYRELGVELAYLPVYGRGHFLAESTPDTRPIDVLFLGTFTPERRAFLDEFKKRLGEDVNVVARDDVREPRSLLDLVSQAKLGLAQGTLTDAVTANGLVRSEGVTERVFDYPLAGTPVLSDERKHLADLLAEGEEVFVFHSVADAAEQVQGLLADPARRVRVAAQARERVLREHLGRHRMLKIAETLVQRGLLPGEERGEAVSRGRELSDRQAARDATIALSVPV